MIALSTVLLFAACGWAGWHCGRRFADESLTALLAGSVVFFAILFMSFHAVGAVELVTGRPLVSVHAALGIAVVLTLIVAIASSRCLQDRLLRRGRKSDADQSDWRPVPTFTAALVAISFLLMAGLLLWGLPRGFESRGYHLPIAVRIMRDGTLSIWDFQAFHAWPANISIWDALLLGALPERFTSLANLPFAALLVAALFGLCRAAGNERSTALLLSAGVMTIPIVAFCTLETAADIGGVAFILIATYMMVVRPGPKLWWVVLSGAAAGISFGFKALHLIEVVALGLTLLALSFWHSKETVPSSIRRISFVPALVWGGTFLLLAAFWLVRNWVERANPFYPLYIPGLFDFLGWAAAPDMQILGRDWVEAEWVKEPWQWLIYPWVEMHFLGQNFKSSSGLGAFFAATIPIVYFLWPLRAIHNENNFKYQPRALAASRVQRVLFFMGTSIFVGWWFLGNHVPYYCMAAIPMLVPLVGTLIGETSGRLRVAYESLLSISILVMGFVVVVKIGIEVGGTMLQDLNPPRHKLLEYPEVVDSLASGSIIANGMEGGWGRSWNYALFGVGFRNRVIDGLETLRLFGAGNGRWRFSRDMVRATGVTHFYAEGSAAIDPSPCVDVRPLASLERNPFNGVAYDSPRVLYEIRLCREAGQTDNR